MKMGTAFCSMSFGIRATLSASAAFQTAFLHKALVVACDEIILDLLERLQRHADDNQQACAAEELCDQRLDAHAAAEKHRQDRQNRHVSKIEDAGGKAEVI